MSPQPVPPLWKLLPPAIRWFNFRYSLPRTAWAGLKLLLGLERRPDDGTPVLMTFSVSPDYVRLWHFFATRALKGKWRLFVFDSSGDIAPEDCPGTEIVRLPNLYHGAKIDLALKHVLSGDAPIFLCDDDKYLLSDPGPKLERMLKEDAAAFSLAPRHWYTFKANGAEHQPMGTYALLFQPKIFRAERLLFRSPTNIESNLRVFPEGMRPHRGYDTADYANEQLLLRGRLVLTEDWDGLAGLDGMTATRLILMNEGGPRLLQALAEAEHFHPGSRNEYTLHAAYCIAAFEIVYRAAFGEAPRLVSGFTPENLRALVAANPKLDADRPRLEKYFAEVDATRVRLLKRVGETR